MKLFDNAARRDVLLAGRARPAPRLTVMEDMMISASRRGRSNNNQSSDQAAYDASVVAASLPAGVGVKYAQSRQV